MIFKGANQGDPTDQHLVDGPEGVHHQQGQGLCGHGQALPHPLQVVIY